MPFAEAAVVSFFDQVVIYEGGHAPFGLELFLMSPRGDIEEMQFSDNSDDFF